MADALVTYAEFTAFSPISTMVTESNFPTYESRAESILSMLATLPVGESQTTAFKSAVMYQIEHVAQTGGVDDWLRGSSAVTSESYTVGGESESKTYASAHSTGKFFNGLSISPMAWMILKKEGMLNTYRGVRVCY